MNNQYAQSIVVFNHAGKPDSEIQVYGNVRAVTAFAKVNGLKVNKTVTDYGYEVTTRYTFTDCSGNQVGTMKIYNTSTLNHTPFAIINRSALQLDKPAVRYFIHRQLTSDDIDFAFMLRPDESNIHGLQLESVSAHYEGRVVCQLSKGTYTGLHDGLLRVAALAKILENPFVLGV